MKICRKIASVSAGGKDPIQCDDGPDTIRRDRDVRRRSHVARQRRPGTRRAGTGGAQVWAGLVLKAEDAVPFVPAMTYCHVTGRFDNGLFRDIVFNGEAMTEKIIYHPEERIEFIRTSGIEMGTIVNEILEDDGALHLRFAFTLKREGLADRSKEETEFAENMARGYLIAVKATVD